MGNKILVIGAGGVGNVVVRKCAESPGFVSKISLASRNLDKCRQIQENLDIPVSISRVDAAQESQLVDLMKRETPDLVINSALPVHNLPIMRACLEYGKAHYLDTSAPEPIAGEYEMFAYSWQTEMHRDFEKKGLMALLSIGFDPGITNVFVAYAYEHLFDTIERIDFLDCNGGSHGKAFATNFNAAVNISEITQPCMHWEDGQWQESPPLSRWEWFNFPEIGRHKMYLMYHEEQETLLQQFPGIRQMRFWMTFSDSYLQHLRVLENVGLTSPDPVPFEGKMISPLEFLAALLPDPSSLGKSYKGKINIGCIITGMLEGERITKYLYVVLDHEQSYRETGSQAISYSTGIPAVIASKLLLEGTWFEPGVHLPETLDPLPMMEALKKNNCAWTIRDWPELGF